MKFERIVLVWESPNESVRRREEITIVPEGTNVAAIAMRFNLYLKSLELVRDIVKEAWSPILGGDQ